MGRNNLKRVFADVVSIDAWHTPFDGERGVASLHVDATFSTARLGGEKDSPIRFRLSLKRAELVVIVPANEPLEVIKDTVSRDQTISSVEISRSQTTNTSAHLGVGALVNSAAPAIAAMNASTGLGMSSQRSEAANINEKTALVLVTQSRTFDGYYRWELKPAIGAELSGRGWDASREPRMKIRDKRKSTRHLPGSARVEIRCKREDLIIDDIVLKDETLLAKLKSAASLKNKVAAVESYLRSVLTSEDLYFTDVSDPFGDICLADVMVEEGCHGLAGDRPTHS